MSDSSTESVEQLDVRGQLMDDTWIAVCQIGSGAFASIWMGYNIRRNKYDAIKIFDSDNERAHEKEMDTMRIFAEEKTQCLMKSTARFLHNIDGETHQCLVFPLMAGSLFSAIDGTGCTLSQLRCIVTQMAKGIQSLHSRGYTHLDIKPENTLVRAENPAIKGLIKKINRQFDITKFTTKKGRLQRIRKFYSKTVCDLPESAIDLGETKFTLDNEPVVVISDLGACRKSDLPGRRVSTIYYRPPEDLLLLPRANTSKSDIWALACTAWEIVTGTILFDHRTVDEDDTIGAHLQTITSVLGPMPLELINRGELCREFYTKGGLLKGVYQISNLRLGELLMEKGSFEDNAEFRSFISFMYSLLKWDPKERPNIDEVLQHEFLKC
jgi:serine/threonine protein kinase